MKTLLLLLLFVASTTVTPARAQTNGFLVFEIGRHFYKMNDIKNPTNITQRFKVPVTEEFLMNFKSPPSLKSMGTGFLCRGGGLKSSSGSTSFMWWIRKTADNRWRINMWGEGVEMVNGVKIGSRSPKTSQNVVIRKLEDLEMSYMHSYNELNGGLNVSFKATFMTAEEMKATDFIPAAPVQKAGYSELFKGDDLTNLPLEISCLFQEG